MAPTWDPGQYLRYADEREHPFWDLVSHIPATAPRDVVDLGCGPGTATERLLGHWPTATVTGVDNSPAMIGQAMPRAQPPRLGFELADLATWEPGPGGVDVILSNAALHWVPGHAELFGRWLGSLRPGGVLAFQVPNDFGAPSHTRLADLAASPEWRDALSSVPAAPGVLTPVDYLRRLRDLGAHVDAWETTYHHVLTGPDPVAEWFRGSALRPYLSALDGPAAARFTAGYAEAMREAYPAEADGTTVLPFRRIFVVATRIA